MKQEIRERIEKIRKGEVPEGYQKTKVGIIPMDWLVSLIDSVAKRGTGHTPNKQFPSYYDGGIKWISLQDSNQLDNGLIFHTKVEISEEGLSNSSAVLHPKGSVLISRDAGVGKSAIMGTDMAVSQHFITWTCSNKLNNWYLYYYLQKRKGEFERIAVGTTIKTIGMPFFKKYKISLPPVKEQEKIAEILSTWKNAIDLKEKLIEEKKVQKENNLRNIFSEKFLKNNFEIKKIQLKDILKQVKEIHYIEEDKLYRQVTISKNGKVSFRGEKPGNKIGRKRQFKINLDKHPESLIFIRQGVLNGGIGIIPKEVNCCVVTENMPMFRIVDIDVTYLKWLIKSPLFQNRIKKIIPDGTAQKAIHEKVLLLESFIIPKDIKDQKIIANIVSLQFNEIELLESELEQTKEQKRGLMQLLLTGIVRVEVD